MLDKSDRVVQLVPDAIIPHQTLPPLRYRDLPEAIPWRKMIGPSFILTGLSLGSGEFVLWPFITYKIGFVFFWACLLGVVTQFFLNMEIERWTLLTGESATTGFCRLSRHWAWIMLVLNVVPWAWPGWATGAGTILSWILFSPGEAAAQQGYAATAPYAVYFAVTGLFLVGLILTLGPVVYQTVEKIQMWLVGFIFAMVLGLSILVIRPDAVGAMVEGCLNLGSMPTSAQTRDLGIVTLLGALAFAGAGGTTNLCQSNFIKDKGYAMGQYIGRITSPITGQEEAISAIGYHFPHTPGNMTRWRKWWRAANIEHFFSFLLTCVLCLILLSLISYSLFYDDSGAMKPGMERFGKGMDFVWGQANVLRSVASSPLLGQAAMVMFLIMGIAILLTTELGVLDATARISTDLVKVNYLRENDSWSTRQLYYLFLWGEILIGSGILLYGSLDPNFTQPLFLLKTSAAMNGGVMFIYSFILLYMNNKILSRNLSMSPLRFVAVVWSCAFFGYFSFQALKLEVFPFLMQPFLSSAPFS